MSPPLRVELQPAFVEGSAGNLFTLRTSPGEGAPKGALLYIHPFGEEMHKSRRMAALQARRFASEGWVVLQFDLYGCGDSDGDFGDARWELWREDARAMLQRLRNSVDGPVLLWGLRLGGSLAAELAHAEDVSALLLWQPVVSGEHYLNHLLRLKLAGDLVKGVGNGSTAAFRDQLLRKEALEIAGNLLSPELAHAISQLKLASLPPTSTAIWMELGTHSSDSLSASSANVIESWRSGGVTINSQIVACQDFWQSQDILDCPALLDASARAITCTIR